MERTAGGEALLGAVGEFLSGDGYRANATGDKMATLSEFLLWTQEQGNDLSSWDEWDWRDALLRFGFPPDRMGDALEMIASWAVVDDATWESEAEQVG